MSELLLWGEKLPVLTLEQQVKLKMPFVFLFKKKSSYGLFELR